MTTGKEITSKDAAQVQPLTLSDAPELQPLDESIPIRLPRLVMVQGNRNEIKDGIARPGEMLNSLTKESYGREVKIVPVLQRPHTRIRWKSRDMGGGILCMSRNKMKPSGDPGDAYNSCSQCEFFKVMDPEQGCSFNEEIVSLLVNGNDFRFWEPIIVNAESTRPSDAGFRDILNIARCGYSRGIRMFHKAYVIKSIEANNRFGQFWKTACHPADKNALLPLDVIEWLESQMKFYAGKNIQEATDVGHEANTVTDNGVGIDANTGAPAGWQ